MAEIVNLNKVRKARVKVADKATAAAHRASHGRTRIERLMSQAEQDRTARLLDGARLDKTGRED